MINFLNDSGFLFSAYKYDEEKRMSVVVSFKSTEPIISSYTTINEIMHHLNAYYKDKCGDVCPYHYIITEDGMCYNVKNCELSVPNKKCRLSEYENDVKVLVMTDRVGSLNDIQKNTLIDLIAEVSENYALFISNTLFYQNTEGIHINDTNTKEEIIIRAIQKRNENNSLFCILEHVINKNLIINDKIIAIPPLTNELTLSDIATQYNVPLSILQNLNPHIVSDKSLDIIFIPNVYALKYKRSAIKILKSLYVNSFDLDELKEEIANVL